MPISLLTEKKIIKKSLKNQLGYLIQQERLSSYLDNNINNWFKKSHSFIQKNNPFTIFRDKWKRANKHFIEKTKSFNQEIINEYESFCHAIGIPFNTHFWLEKLKENAEEKELAFRLLLNEWQKNLDKAQARWELEQINQAREKFLSELQKWLELIQQLEQNLSPFGLDFGLWFDDSLGSLSQKSIETLKRWATYFSNNKEIQKIADLLGKMRQIEQSSKIETITQAICVNVPKIDVDSKEEIIGLRLGKDLEYALPSELALMADSETTILFDLKYLESKLVCFELQGTTYQEKIDEISEVETQEKEKLGPMILCIDTSGSMNGMPEYIAKAIAFYLGNKAKSQDRKCLVINFSKGIETFEISATRGIVDLSTFLQKSFHGGTDAAPALYHALSLCQSENYKKADVLMISDFIMGELPETLLNQIQQQREKGNKFNSLVIGNLFMNNRLKTYFDNEWIYNPNSQQIEQLVNFSKM
ncbi:hypothetical protein BKK54_10855 [Rodentibacter genomosp. 1]|uniref:VWFA domain-containing protein n=1 Tax=Rodentibacter genomosp. 1 TaxID=1908264 RepID=A0A1V3J1C7_9PAST|nr:VWA domain-containing protein [Rodentibacter genomosp. 1]OOF48435.1 hypothetical protein BKK54_10855 [Rodentibacter genomosp. 1]